MSDMSVETGTYEAKMGDYFALLKPRVMLVTSVMDGPSDKETRPGSGPRAAHVLCVRGGAD